MTRPMPPFRIIVSGTRDDVVAERNAGFIRDRIHRACSEALAAGRLVVIVEGECPQGGVDRVAREWGNRTPGVTVDPHPANWAKFGKAAGMIRNREMVQAGADICLAFPVRGSRGTINCMQQAAEAGIPGQWHPLY